MKEALTILGTVVHEMQRERGSVAMFLNSEGALFADQIQEQFLKSDETIMALQEALGRWRARSSIDSAQIVKLDTVLDVYGDLSDFRGKVSKQEIPVSQVINHYSIQIIRPILQTMTEVALFMEGTNPALVSAYNAFLQWRESIGLERSIGVRGFTGDSFQNEEFVERLLFLFAEQDTFQTTFMALASEAQKELVQRILESEACQKLDELHDLLCQSPGSQVLSDISPVEWFDLISAKIDAFHDIEGHLIETLLKPIGVDKSTAQNGVNSQNGPSRLGSHETFIRTLQLFAGLEQADLDLLLQHGQVRSFDKGKLLFLEGEPANRLYIILNGWVKIFKGTASGEETILQMLSSGEAILDSAVFLNTSFPVSAQVAEDVVLLSVPAPIVREQIKNNSKLALNLLASMSYRSQGLIRQIENARLKSVDERIGWFLLKLLLEQGRVSRSVELPYDKSLIASYLDMKRETFSRSLKRMKDKGFKIENDIIVIPELNSLCDFCNIDTANICALHGSEDCPNPQCTHSEPVCA